MNHVSFSKIAIVSCGTLSIELDFLKDEGFLDTDLFYYSTPGLHEDIQELERQLIRRIQAANENFPWHAGGAVVLDGTGFTG